MTTGNTNAPARIVLIGESGAGKSHFGGQLLLRLNQQRFALRMRGAATNLSAYEEVIEALNEGRSAGHTATATYVESEWPVVNAEGRALDLVWPDYGGEQVRHLIDGRQVPAAWRERLINSAGWLLMVRIHHAGVDDDFFSRPLADIRSKPETEQAGEIRPSAQARLIELLQMLLFIRGIGTVTPIAEPALTVLLSCWDELGDAAHQKPGEVMARRLPLVASFLDANWRSERLSVLGVSALEKPLRPDRADEDYISEGPERFGYVVLPDGTHTPDLTAPIAALAAMIAR